jgi:hypothetical protein
VAFKDLTEFFQCAVVEPKSIGGSLRPVVADHSVSHFNCDTREEAYFFAGLLNSIPARVVLHGAATGVQTQRYFSTDISRLKFPSFSSETPAHKAIVDLSVECHALAAKEKWVELDATELELATAVAPIWKLNAKQVAGFVSAYQELRDLIARIGVEEDDEEDEDDEGGMRLV